VSLNFPWEAFLTAQRAKNENQQQMFQNIAGIGQGLATAGDAGLQYRKMKIVKNLFKDNPAMNQWAQVDPDAALKAAYEQTMMSPVYVDDKGAPSLTQTPGSNLFGSMKRDEALKLIEQHNDRAAQLAATTQNQQEMHRLQQLQMETNKLIAEGRIEEAKQRLQQEAENKSLQLGLQTQVENSKHPVQNWWRGLRGKPPVINPGQSYTAGVGGNMGGGGGITVQNFTYTPKK
jgi:hypothetical protein